MGRRATRDRAVSPGANSLTRILSMTRCDVSFQFRHGFYYAYAFVTAIYTVVLFSLPDSLGADAGVLLIFSDTSVLGLFFVGGIVILERDQGTLQHLFVTPLRVHEYLISKVLSLALLSITASTVVGMAAWGVHFRLLPFIAAVVLSSVIFTLAGIAFAARSRSINAFLAGSAVCIAPASLPLLEYFGVASNPALWVFPTAGTLSLLDGSVHGIGAVWTATAVLSMLPWAAIVYVWADRWFRHYVISSIGGDQWDVV